MREQLGSLDETLDEEGVAAGPVGSISIDGEPVPVFGGAPVTALPASVTGAAAAARGAAAARPAATAAGGLVGIETLSPGTVSDPLRDAAENVGEAGTRVAGAPLEGAASGAADALNPFSDDGSTIGGLVLLVGGILALLVLTPLGAALAGVLGDD